MPAKTEGDTMAASLSGLELLDEAVVVYDPDGAIRQWNRGATRLYGIDASTAKDLVIADVFGRAADPARLDGQGRDVRQRADGRRLAIQWRRERLASGLVVEVSSPVREPDRFDDELTRYRTIYRGAGAAIWEHDWSGVWEGVEQLRRAGVTDFRTYFHRQPDILAELSSRVRLKDANDEAVRLFEADDRDHLVNGPLPRIFTDDTRASFTRSLSSLIERAPRIESECGFKTLRGNSLRIMLRVTPVDEERWQRVVVTMIDITERSRAQAALNQALDELAHINRVTTLGELTASIAHELNQPLVAVVTEGQSAIRWLNRDPPEMAEAQAGIRRSIQEGLRAGEILHRLRALARKSKRQFQRVSLNDILDEANMLVLREMQRREVTVRVVKAEGLPEVMADPIQLQQVVINFLINAAQAMEGPASGDREIVASTVAIAPDMVGVAVSDSGPGFPDEERDALFRPFFSTKDAGLGMGLSICRSIMEAHGGRIWIDNRPEGGAVAQFSLATADNVVPDC